MGENTDSFLMRIIALSLDNYPHDISEAINGLYNDGDLTKDDLERFTELFENNNLDELVVPSDGD